MPLRRPLALAVTLLTALVAVVGSTLPAVAADGWAVPANAKIVVKGHGYGHGHGMSQYGAEGAARAGLTFKRIAEFYYPGTTWGTTDGKIGVLLTADTTDDVVVLARSGLRVHDLTTDESLVLPTGTAKRWRLVGSGATTVVSYLAGGWHRWAVLAGDGEFYAQGQPISVVTPAGTADYRGRVRAASPSPGASARDTVNVLTLENYLRGVVPREMPALWSREAVRAQAVAARTYADYGRNHPQAGHYDICDTTSCQVYGGYGAEETASDAAIVATAHQALMVDGEAAFTQFSSSSGGWTAAGSVPYLTAHADPYDDWAGNPVHTWTLPFTDNAIEGKFPKIGNLRRLAIGERDGHGDWGGRAGTVTLVGSKGRVTVSGDSFRSTMGLRSSWFTFTVKTA